MHKVKRIVNKFHCIHLHAGKCLPSQPREKENIYNIKQITNKKKAKKVNFIKVFLSLFPGRKHRHQSDRYRPLSPKS